jgi:hypothetical protein
MSKEKKKLKKKEEDFDDSIFEDSETDEWLKNLAKEEEEEI